MGEECEGFEVRSREHVSLSFLTIRARTSEYVLVKTLFLFCLWMATLVRAFPLVQKKPPREEGLHVPEFVGVIGNRMVKVVPFPCSL